MVSGDLSVFPLLPVMQMLLASSRSGKFTVQHERGGVLWLKNGDLVHAQSGDLTGEHALQLMCSLDGGTFTFEPDQSTNEISLNMRQDSALHRMLTDHEAWLNLMRVFPDWSRPLRFTARWTDQQPVTRPQYRVLAFLHQGLSLRQIVDQSGMPPRQVLETYRPFLIGGLIEVA